MAKLTKKQKFAFNELMAGRKVSFSGWPAEDIAAVLDKVIQEWGWRVNKGRQQVARMIQACESAKEALADGEAALNWAKEARATLAKLVEESENNV